MDDKIYKIGLVISLILITIAVAMPKWIVHNDSNTLSTIENQGLFNSCTKQKTSRGPVTCNSLDDAKLKICRGLALAAISLLAITLIFIMIPSIDWKFDTIIIGVAVILLITTLILYSKYVKKINDQHQEMDRKKYYKYSSSFYLGIVAIIIATLSILYEEYYKRIKKN